jgi:hypothetical protein
MGSPSPLHVESHIDSTCFEAKSILDHVTSSSIYVKVLFGGTNSGILLNINWY